MPTLAILLLALVAQGAPAKPFVSEAGGFKIAMPVAVEELTREVPSPRGPIRVHYYLAEHRTVHYIVSHTDYPGDVAAQDPDALLEEAAVGPVKGVGGTLLTKANRRIGRSPGKELAFSFQGPGNVPSLGRVRLYLAGSRMYSLTLIGPKAEVDAAGDAFFASFAIARTISSPPAGTAPAAAAAADPAMRRTRALPAAEAPSAEPPATLAPFESAVGGFRVAMPTKPEPRVQSGKTVSGPIETHMFVSQKEEVYYVATYADLPGITAEQDPARTLATAVEEKVTISKGSLVANRPITLGTVPGREFDSTVKSADGSVRLARSRIYLARGRLYQLTAFGPAEAVRSKAGDDFLDSFSLTAAPARRDGAASPR
jgi:hypothetical protein